MRIKHEMEHERTNKNHIEIKLENQIKLGADEMKGISGQIQVKDAAISSLESEKTTLVGKLESVEASNR